MCTYKVYTHTRIFFYMKMLDGLIEVRTESVNYREITSGYKAIILEIGKFS